MTENVIEAHERPINIWSEYGTIFNEHGQYCIPEQSFPKEQLNKSRLAYVHVFRTT